MNLYQIMFSHHSPKGSKIGIHCLLLAENDEQVYEWLASEPVLKDKRYTFNSWKTINDEHELLDVYNEDYDIVGSEGYKEKIIRLKGDMNDDDVDFTDAYYGITLYGWELLKENVTTDYSELEELGVVYRIT